MPACGQLCRLAGTMTAALPHLDKFVAAALPRLLNT